MTEFPLPKLHHFGPKLALFHLILSKPRDNRCPAGQNSLLKDEIYLIICLMALRFLFWKHILHYYRVLQLTKEPSASCSTETGSSWIETQTAGKTGCDVVTVELFSFREVHFLSASLFQTYPPNLLPNVTLRSTSFCLNLPP